MTAAAAEGPANGGASSPRWERRFRAASAWLSGSVILLGILVLVGWALDIAILKRIHPSFVAMPATTALLFVVLGIGLWHARSHSARSTRARRMLGLFVATVAAVALVEDVFDVDLWIDELVFHAPESATHSARMAPVTALGFLLLGLALVFQDGRRTSGLGRAAALLATLFALVALFGYVFGAPSLYAIEIFSTLALRSAVGLLLAACAFLLARPGVGIAGLVSSDDATGRLLRRLVPVSALGPLAMGWLVLSGQIAGYFDARFGIALMVLTITVSLGLISYAIATPVRRAELTRRQAESDRQRLLEQRQAAEAGRIRQLREMVENAPNSVALFDNDMHYVQTSPGWLRDYGIGPDVIGRSHYDLFPDLPDRWKAVHRRCLAGATEENDGDPFTRLDGTTQWTRWKVCPWRAPDGAIAGIVIYAEEITERKRAEQERERMLQEIGELSRNLELGVAERTTELAIARDKLDGIIAMAADAIVSVDDDQRITIFNKSAEQVFGWTQDEVVGKPLELVWPAHRDHVARLATAASEPRETSERVAIVGIRKNGETFPAEAAISKLETDAGSQVTVILHDITDRKRREDEQARAHAERALLLREIHHRVKNNLQVISSLFYLQAQRTEQASVRKLLDESRGRLQSIAIIHEKLYRSERLASIDFGDYLRDLTASLTSAIGVQAPHVEVRVDAEGIFLDIDRAIPCALIVNELVSNSLKHAFPGGRRGEIRIAVRAGDPDIQLEVSDTGVGIPPELDISSVTTLGLQLVGSLTKQLNGAVEVVRGEGTTFRFHFPAAPAAHRSEAAAHAQQANGGSPAS